MTADEFNFESLDERAKLVWILGDFLTMRQRYGCTVVLYHLEGIFAEVWYYPEDNSILMVHGFEQPACLKPYLDKIDISELYKKK